jgi:hypothetical protein
MSFQDVLQISVTVLASLGGGGVIVVGFASWLGKVWAARILEQDRKKYTAEIEELKARLQHEMQFALKQRDQSFNLSITSHMANVLFDKHVAFCEEYAARAHQCVRELFRDGPSENAMSIFQELTAIRQKHAPWVTADILEKLKPFEEAVWNIGYGSKYADVLDTPSHCTHTKNINALLNIIGQQVKDGEVKPEIRADQVLIYLQDALRISELARLRSVVVRKAMQDVDGEISSS